VQLGAEVTAMYRAAGVSPFAGLLPVLAQAPFFLLWYRAFTAGGGGLLDQTFLGATLASRFIAAPGPFLLLLGVLAGLAAVAAWRSRRVAATTGAPAPHAVLTALPFLTVVTATFLPLAAVLYMVTTVAWTTVENVVLRRGLPARSTRPDGAPGPSAIPQPANGVVAQRERRDSGGGDA
jgi:YidC/Oxa1 family membrane protein insertase